jgi:23S rRNA pseudouridine1911/1915/1917 synthase
MAVRNDTGRESRTGYRVLERLRAATLVEAALHTGRTHQIRVHFQFLGYPVAGDATYGQRQNRRLEELVGFAMPRLMLHAFQLAFIHPRSGKRLKFEAPHPAEFDDVLKALR